MDPNLPASVPFHKPLEILRKQIWDLHLSLRLPQSQTSFPVGQGMQGLEQLVNHAGIGLYRSTVDGQLIMANAVLAGIFGYDSPEEMMKDVTDFETQLFLEPERRKAWWQLFDNQETIGPVLWRSHGTDNELWLEEQARVIRDHHGCILGYEGIVLNVTERYIQELLPQDFDRKDNVIEETDVSEGFNRNAQLRQELADAQQTIATLREQLDRFQVATMGSQEGLWEGHALPDHSWDLDRKSTRLNSSHTDISRMPSSA